MREETFIPKENFNKDQFFEFVLVGDIGGTNCRLAIFGKSRETALIFSFVYESKYINNLWDPINEILREAKSRYDIEVKDCCLGCAGPVSSNRDFCQFTNLSWSVDSHEILKNTLLNSVSLINDFEATGYGIHLLKNHQLFLLPHPKSNPSSQKGATKAVIGAGTGLGKAILIFDKQKQTYYPVPSEGGHGDFHITEEIEIELVRWWKRKNETDFHPDYEEFLSGKGLVNIYNFLRAIHLDKSNRYSQEIDIAEDKAAAIAEHVINDRTCKRAMEMFLKIYCKAARNFALDTLSLGGLYIAGGIVPKILNYIKQSKFMNEFERNLHQGKILEQIPVYVVIEEKIGLYGAANVALNFKELGIKR
ncbi:MAG: glucokinase [Candidatus Woesearchaeota archaeon]